MSIDQPKKDGFSPQTITEALEIFWKSEAGGFARFLHALTSPQYLLVLLDLLFRLLPVCDVDWHLSMRSCSNLRKLPLGFSNCQTTHSLDKIAFLIPIPQQLTKNVLWPWKIFAMEVSMS